MEEVEVEVEVEVEGCIVEEEDGEMEREEAMEEWSSMFKLPVLARRARPIPIIIRPGAGGGATRVASE